MTKRNIIIAVTAVLAVAIAVTAIIAVSRKKSGGRITEPTKTSSEYREDESRSEGEKKAADNSAPENVDVIDIGKDIKEEGEELELEKAEDTSKGSNGKSDTAASGTGSKTDSGSDSGKDSGSKTETESSEKSDSTDKSKDSMTGWTAWE